MQNIVVINIGGSILSLSETKLFDFEKALQIKKILQEFEDKFILCVGGGFIARKYQQLLIEENKFSESDIHSVGVAAINLNANMLKAAMSDIAEERVFKYEDFEGDSEIAFDKHILISAAGKPGHSSDWNTVKLALRSNAKKIFSFTNIDGVYSADPKKDLNATRFDKLSFDEYLEVIGNPSDFKPGDHYPFDPLASKLAQENGISVVIINGLDNENITKALRNEAFVGTIIG